MNSEAAKRTAFLVYLYMFAIGAALLALVGYGVYDSQIRASAFDRSGITVTATYIGGRVLRASSRPERPPTFQYFGQVQFPIDGRTITAEGPVSSEFHRNVEPGDAIQIRHLPDEPETVQIDPTYETRSSGMIWILTLLVAGCLTYWLTSWWLSKRIP